MGILINTHNIINNLTRILGYDSNSVSGGKIPATQSSATAQNRPQGGANPGYMLAPSGGSGALSSQLSMSSVVRAQHSHLPRG